MASHHSFRAVGPTWNHQEGHIGDHVNTSRPSREEHDRGGRCATAIGGEAHYFFLHREWHRPREFWRALQWMRIIKIACSENSRRTRVGNMAIPMDDEGLYQR